MKKLRDVDVNEVVESNGDTPLMKGSRDGVKARVAALIILGARVNEAKNDGWTALMYAAHFGRDHSAPGNCSWRGRTSWLRFPAGTRHLC